MSASALIGLWASDYFRFTMVWLGVLIVAIPLFLPKAMRTLSRWAVRKTTSGLMLYLFAELKELIAPLSLAMMALLLAVTANIGMNTLVGSFEFTLKQWLEQRLHADIYVSPSQRKMAEVEQALYQFEGVDKVYKQYYVDEKILGLPTLLGTKDPSTLEQTMVFKSHTPDFWDNFYSGEVASYYYSQPFIQVDGEVVIDGEIRKVAGKGWIDREWSSQFLLSSQQGWDWFALRLNADTSLVVFQLRDSESGDTSYAHAKLMNKDGSGKTIDQEQITLRVASQTAIDGRSYPTEWQIQIPDHKINLTVLALNPNAKMPLTIPYWEGPVQFSGSHYGSGYMELTGY